MLAWAQEDEDDNVISDDAEDLVRDADVIMDDLVLLAPAGVDLNRIAQWKRRVEAYYRG